MNTPQFPAAITSRVNDLGMPKLYFPVKKLNRVGSLIACLLLLCSSILIILYGLYVASMAYQKHGLAVLADMLMVPMIIALVLLLLGLAAGWLAYRDWSKGVAVYERGLAIRDRKGLQIWRWEDVVSLTVAITRQHTIGIYTGTTHVYKLFNRHNQRLVLNDTYIHVEELAKTIQDNTFPLLYDQAARQYNAGQRLVFGAVAISQAGIQVGKKTFPWTEVKQISIQQGILKVSHKNGGWLSGVSASVSDISNLNVLLNIIHQVVGLKVD